MATRIRLQRHGKKGKPFFHLVAADSRAKRDGKFIEKLGTYNPTANPAVIDINFDATLAWVQTGAEMSDTARAILSYKGVLYKNHLLNGVKKGALTAEQVEERFNQWLASKEAKIEGKISGLAKNAEKQKADRMAAEVAANAAKAAAVEAKNRPEVEEVVAEEAPATEEVTEEVSVDENSTDKLEAIVEEVVEKATKALKSEIANLVSAKEAAEVRAMSLETELATAKSLALGGGPKRTVSPIDVKATNDLLTKAAIYKEKARATTDITLAKGYKILADEYITEYEKTLDK
jgi:small subunit ribosomal protein S16